MKLSFIGLLLWFLVAEFAYANDRWETLPVIKPLRGMHLQWIAKDIRYNGLQTSIQSFQIDRPVDEVVNRYERDWRAKVGSEITRTKNGNFAVVGMEDGKYFYTVQVREIGRRRSEGTLTVSVSPRKIDKRKHSNKTDFPLPNNTNLINRIESKDGGIIAENVLVQSKMPKEYLLRWFSSRLSEQGWVVQRDYRNNKNRAGQLLVQKDGQHASVVVSEIGRLGKSESVVEINWVKGNGKQ